MPDMKSVAFLFMHLLVLFAKSLKSGGTKAVIAENLLLKQQLIVLSRARRKAPNLQTSDRFLFGALSLLISPRRLLTVAIIIKPATLLKFHRALVKRKYRCLFSNKGHSRDGPKGPSRELINAIVDLKQRNPRYGCPRLAYIITLTFGFEINKDIVRRILAKHFKPKPANTQGPSWLSFLGHSKDSLWSIDLFRCESLTLKSYWILVVIDQWSRRIIGFGIHQGDVDGVTGTDKLTLSPLRKWLYGLNYICETLQKWEHQVVEEHKMNVLCNADPRKKLTCQYPRSLYSEEMQEYVES